jgi:RND family efflux transporter MFP subunit
MNLRVLGAIATVLTLAASVSGCKAPAQASTGSTDSGRKLRTVTFDPAALTRLGVKVDIAGNTGADYELEVPGELEYGPETYAEVGTVVEGRVTQIFVKVGTAVKKGQALASIVVPSIANAQAEYVSAEAASRFAKTNADREGDLLKRELTTAREAELARGESIRTQSELAAAGAKLDVLGVARPSAGAAIRAGTLTLTAPIDGVIVRRDVVLGRFLQAKENAFVVADPSHLHAEINVFEGDLPYFKVGAPAEVKVDSMPGKVIKGTIDLIEPGIGNASRAARAHIEINNADGTLKPGMFVRAEVRLPESGTNGRLLVPSAAVQPLGQADVVFVEQKPGTFEVRTVTLARRTSQVAEIREGLQRGERIVIEGGFVLRGEVTKQ